MATPKPILLTGILLLVAMRLSAQQAQTPQAQEAKEAKSVPVIDGGIGSCSADLTVTDNAGEPVYNAKIRVHIAYGFGGWHKMDLEVGTNVDGKARFAGLPERTKSGLFFRAAEGGREGSAFDDPAKTCSAQFTVALEKKNP